MENDDGMMRALIEFRRQLRRLYIDPGAVEITLPSMDDAITLARDFTGTDIVPINFPERGEINIAGFNFRFPPPAGRKAPSRVYARTGWTPWSIE